MTEATGDIHKVLLIGDNHISASIINALSKADYDLHQISSPHQNDVHRSNITVHISTLDHDTLVALFSTLHPDIIISTLTNNLHSSQQTIIAAALAAKVPRIIPSEFGHDTLNTALQARLPPYRDRARILTHLQSLATTTNQLTYVALATGVLLDRGLATTNLGFDLQWQSATMHGTGDESFAASSIPWIGRAVLAVLQNWEKVQNSYIYAAGSITTPNAVLRSLEDATGQEWEVGRGGTVSECIAEAERRVARGFPDAGMFLMERSVLYDDSLDGDEGGNEDRLDAVRPFRERDAKGLLGLGEGESLRDVVEGVVHDFRHHGKGDCGCG